MFTGRPSAFFVYTGKRPTIYTITQHIYQFDNMILLKNKDTPFNNVLVTINCAVY